VIAYIDDDEWYPWYSISNDKAYHDLEIEIDELEYTELLALQGQAHEFQEHLRKIYNRVKGYDT